MVVLQIVAKKFHPFLYWATIIASTTAGTTMADFADRSLGIGYTGGSSILFLCVMGVLGLWYWSERTIAVETVSKPKTEAFYWATITFSQTLGTALGDWMADTSGFGFFGAALVFTAALAVVAMFYYWTNISRVLLFLVAFILTRPLGATVGDFLDKPLNHGELNFSRPLATAIIAVITVACVILIHSVQDCIPRSPQQRHRMDGGKDDRRERTGCNALVAHQDQSPFCNDWLIGALNLIVGFLRPPTSQLAMVTRLVAGLTQRLVNCTLALAFPIITRTTILITITITT